MGLTLSSLRRCKQCNRKPVWRGTMRNTLRCPGPLEDICDTPVTRSTPEAAVEAWNERHG